MSSSQKPLSIIRGLLVRELLRLFDDKIMNSLMNLIKYDYTIKDLFSVKTLDITDWIGKPNSLTQSFQFVIKDKIVATVSHAITVQLLWSILLELNSRRNSLGSGSLDFNGSKKMPIEKISSLMDLDIGIVLLGELKRTSIQHASYPLRIELEAKVPDLEAQYTKDLDIISLKLGILYIKTGLSIKGIGKLGDVEIKPILSSWIGYDAIYTLKTRIDLEEVNDTTSQIMPMSSSEYVGNDFYKCTVFVKADEKVLNSIDYVEYILHPTFMEPCRKIYDRKTNFQLELIIWGEFEAKIRVFFKDGRSEILSHLLQLM